MLWALRDALTLTLLASSPPSEGVALVYSPSIELHRGFARALERIDPSVVPIALEDTWRRDAAPRAAIALGLAAAERLRSEWPSLPQAHLLLWETPASSPSLERWSTLHPDTACTASVLHEIRPGPGWVVLAADTDEGAADLAAALGGTFVAGEARDHYRRLRRETTQNVWLRGAPDLAAAPEWIELLALLARLDGIYVGTDLPAANRTGLASPVAIDVEEMAADTAKWISRIRRGRKRRSRQMEVPCKPS